MKKTVVILCMFCAAVSLQNCSKQNLSPDLEAQSLREGSFFGEKVTLSDGLTQEKLDQSPEDFLKELYKSNSSARINGDNDLGITGKVLNEFVTKQLEKYPELNLEKMEIKRFGILKKDFPEIISLEDAFNISGKIVEFYDVKLRQDIKDNMQEMKRKSKAAKVAVGIQDLNAMEISYAAMHVLAGSKVGIGAIDGDAWTKVKYPGLGIDNNDKVNAYRHTIWAMASIAKMLIAGMPKSDAIGKCRDFLTCHEMKYVGNIYGLKPSALPGPLLALHPTWGLEQTNLNAMDLSNNGVGRSLIDNQTSKPLFSGWNGVSEAAIKATMATKVDPPATFKISNTIISTFHANQWDAIASNRYGGTGPLYIID